ncbi:MAG: thiamine phosphate synthase [Acidobacteria bacterium]|nr:thiamine phosphate synthase [Acidobacteriota bacterium]MCW5949840.1 thiamine phosphate synthase [Pyrinomonadaceae bacterium]
MKLHRPISYLITDGTSRPDTFEHDRRRIADIGRKAVDQRVSMIQLREKGLPTRQLFELAGELAEIVSGSETRLLINDRADIAAASGADGVHMTSRSLRADDVRGAFGNEMLIGVSCHSAIDVELAAERGADFAVFGPVFSTPGKFALGVEALAAACTVRPEFTVLALGGVDASNVEQVLAAGARGAAAIRAMADDRLIRRLRELDGRE